MSIEWMVPSNHLILCRPLLFLPSIFPRIRRYWESQVNPIRNTTDIQKFPKNLALPFHSTVSGCSFTHHPLKALILLVATKCSFSPHWDVALRLLTCSFPPLLPHDLSPFSLPASLLEMILDKCHYFGHRPCKPTSIKSMDSNNWRLEP